MSRNNRKAAQTFPDRGDDAVDDRCAELDTLARLQAENTRLIGLLEAHGIEWWSPPAPAQDTSKLSTQEKVTLFRKLFQGRDNVYPVRREGRRAGKRSVSSQHRSSLLDLQKHVDHLRGQ